MKRYDWTKRLRDRLAEHKEPAPDGLWEAIETSLADADSGVTGARVMTLRRWIAAAVVTAFVLGGVTYWFNMDKASSDDVAVINKKTLNEKGSNKSLSEKNTLIAQNVTDIPSVDPRVKAYGEERKSVGTDDSSVVGDDTAVTETDATETDHVSDMKQDKTSAQENKGTETRSTRKEPRSLYNTLSELIIVGSKDTGNRWSAGVFTSGAMGGSQNGMNGPNPLFMSDLVTVNSALLCDHEITSETETPSLLLSNVNEKIVHHRPVSLGLSVKYRLDDRWALSSGLVYTGLMSDATCEVGNNKTTEEYSRYYIGVPLKAIYNVWNNKIVSTYINAGGEMDCNFKAKTTTDGHEKNAPKDKMQFSASAALGVQLNIVPQFGVYVEPGVNYYFDNGSSVATYFKEKKLNFGLQIGLRYNIE